MIIRNTDGLTAIGNRYFGSKNAADVARAYSRTESKEISVKADIYAGNRQSDQLKIVENGIERVTYDPLPKPSHDAYATARNIFDRIVTIAQAVVDEGDNLSGNQRALYDAEFQELRQRLTDHNIGSNPTAAAIANPAGAKLENLELFDTNDSLVSVEEAEKVVAHARTSQTAVDLQEGGAQADQLELINVARKTYFTYQDTYGAHADQIEQYRSDYNRMQTDPTVQLIGRYNPRIEQNLNKSSIISLLA